MLQQKQFKHESLQDKKSIQNILKAVAKAIAKGELKFSDEDDEIILTPKGLLNLKVSARNQAGEQRLDLRVTWKTEEKAVKKSSINVE